MFALWQWATVHETNHPPASRVQCTTQWRMQHQQTCICSVQLRWVAMHTLHNHPPANTATALHSSADLAIGPPPHTQTPNHHHTEPGTIREPCHTNNRTDGTATAEGPRSAPFSCPVSMWNAAHHRRFGMGPTPTPTPEMNNHKLKRTTHKATGAWQVAARHTEKSSGDSTGRHSAA